jgi:hypothetical protein
MPLRKHNGLGLLLATFLVLGGSAAAQAPATTPSLQELEIADKARIALEKLPYYGPFDLIGFGVQGSTVTLYGWAYQAVNKDEAEDVVKKVPGVTRVVNKIEALPVSMSDDRIRRAVFAKIYSDDFLQKYGTPILGLNAGRWGRRYWGRGLGAFGGFLGTEPIGNYAIHIIVKGGRVTLYGTVNSDVDKIKAGMDARDVFGVLGVDNQLQVVKD